MTAVLFVCVQNAGRSPMAKAFFDHLAAERGLAARADSAGTAPAAQMHPDVIAVMQEIGLDLAGEAPQLLTNELVERAERIVAIDCTVDSGTAPAVARKRVDAWELPDLRGKPIAELRRIRDQTRQRV